MKLCLRHVKKDTTFIAECFDILAHQTASLITWVADADIDRLLIPSRLGLYSFEQAADASLKMITIVGSYDLVYKRVTFRILTSSNQR